MTLCFVSQRMYLFASTLQPILWCTDNVIDPSSLDLIGMRERTVGCLSVVMIAENVIGTMMMLWWIVQHLKEKKHKPKKEETPE